MRILRKNGMTLLEMVIAMGLVSMLVTMLMSYLHTLTQLEKDLKETQESAAQWRYANQRLFQVFSNATHSKQKHNIPLEKSRKRSYFYLSEGTSPKSLVFTFDNERGTYPFVNEVLARLYLDEETQSLCLAKWPLLIDEETKEVQMEMQKEVLLRNVSSLHFQFYVPSKGKSEELSGWFQVWDMQRNKEKVPALVKLHLVVNGEENVFTYGTQTDNTLPKVF